MERGQGKLVGRNPLLVDFKLDGRSYRTVSCISNHTHGTERRKRTKVGERCKDLFTCKLQPYQEKKEQHRKQDRIQVQASPWEKKVQMSGK